MILTGTLQLGMWGCKQTFLHFEGSQVHDVISELVVTCISFLFLPLSTLPKCLCGKHYIQCFVHDSSRTVTRARSWFSACRQLALCGVDWQLTAWLLSLLLPRSLSPEAPEKNKDRPGQRDTQNAFRKRLPILRGLPRQSAGAATSAGKNTCSISSSPSFLVLFLSVSALSYSLRLYLNLCCCITTCLFTSPLYCVFISVFASLFC